MFVYQVELSSRNSLLCVARFDVTASCLRVACNKARAIAKRLGCRGLVPRSARAITKLDK
jgi:hypothetical protein